MQRLVNISQKAKESPWPTVFIFGSLSSFWFLSISELLSMGLARSVAVVPYSHKAIWYSELQTQMNCDENIDEPLLHAPV